MKTIDIVRTTIPEIVTSDVGINYAVVSWSVMDTIHSDDTIRKTLYTGNKIIGSNMYATFNVIPKSSSEINAHVAVRI